jgi:uncharacterized protein (TIGR00730 family)
MRILCYDDAVTSITSQPPKTAVPESEETFQVVENALFSLWTVVNELSRIKPPAAFQRFRVTVFGSARIKIGSRLYNDVKHLAAELSAMGCDVVTGGGPGLMEAANEGEQIGDPDHKNTSYGIRIALPFEQGTNPFVEKVFVHQTFFTRLHHFVRLSNAFVVFDGGIGTTLEMMMIWQLLQVRQATGTPLIAIGDMWQDLVAWARTHMLRPNEQLAGSEDMSIPICCTSVEDALKIISKVKAESEASNQR